MKVRKLELIGVDKGAVLCSEERVPSPSAGKVLFNHAEGSLVSLMPEAQISSLKKLLQALLTLTAGSAMLQQASRGCSCPTRQQAVKPEPPAINPCSHRPKNNSSCHTCARSPPP